MSFYLENAEILVDAAHTHAVSSLVAALDSYPALEDLVGRGSTRYWDVLVTIAGVGMAVIAGADRIPEAEQEQVSSIISRGLRQLHPEGEELLDDFSSFVMRNAEGGVGPEAAVGAWVVYNLKQGQPTKDELQLAFAIGTLVIANFRSWWDKPSSASS